MKPAPRRKNRPGQGRKPSPNSRRNPVTIRVNDETMLALERMAIDRHVTVTLLASLLVQDAVEALEKS